MIANFDVPLPPLPEQHRIAAILDKADRLLRIRREALRQAEHLFQTLLHRVEQDGAMRR